MPQELKPDMFWDDSGSERVEDSIHDVLDWRVSNDTADVGDIIEIHQAIRLPTRKYRVIPCKEHTNAFDLEEVKE